jgi:hypothetical protein
VLTAPIGAVPTNPITEVATVVIGALDVGTNMVSTPWKNCGMLVYVRPQRYKNYLLL